MSSSDAEEPRCGELVTTRLVQSTQNSPPIEFFKRQQLIALRHAFTSAVLQIREEISHVQEGTGAKSDRAFDGIFQFSHIARPALGNQAGHSVFGNLTHTTLRISEFLQKQIHQNGNVALALPQCRQFELYEIQPIKQILAKLALTHRRIEIAVGCSDHARRNGHAIGGTNRLHFLLLQSAQEFCLQIDGQVAAFVEEERATGGRFHRPSLRVRLP